MTNRYKADEDASMPMRETYNLELDRLRGDLAYLTARKALLNLELLAKFDPDQPRAPAGTSDGGKWVAVGRIAARVAGFAARRAPVIGPALLLYDLWSQFNEPGRRAIVEFPAREFVASGDGASVAVRQLTGEDVDEFCPRYGEVQERTDRVAEVVRREQPGLSASQFGTEAHVRLQAQIDGLRDPNLRAEVSVLKTIEETGAEPTPARYGVKGSIRIDVLERVRNDLVCVYDLKTGARGLNPARSAEIARAVISNYGSAKKVIVTEVRPNR